ncbi:GNAT family N-acetyltransferase [Streptomyces sp. NPDC060209]|uniref:GNAT family N-acetyltransferase n=1 Tax=Streptomyces sp. NPDC060209 TaxID=3347073 RepID=UPI0036552479
MPRGRKVGLRARHEDDIQILQTELYDDVANYSRSEVRPWRPITPGSKDSRFVVDDTEQRHVPFSVVELDGGTLVGTATLWDIDNHNRSAHIGLGLEGVLRSSAWVMGEFLDDVLLGLLVQDWKPGSEG